MTLRVCGRGFLPWIVVLLLAWGGKPQEEIKVVTTTSLIGSILREVGRDRVEVRVIVPSSTCPGHFDLRPGDIKLLADAQLLLSHGWERFVKRLLRSTQSKRQIAREINIPGNWMVPEVYLKAVERILPLLCELDPDNREYFQNNATVYRRKILKTGEELKKRAEEMGVGEINVVCSEMQKEFLRWLGFKVVATYGRPSELTPRQIKRVITVAREKGAKIVVDNLQSGPQAGTPVVEEIGGVHVVLTNFPIRSYLESLRDNAEKLFKAVEALRCPSP